MMFITNDMESGAKNSAFLLLFQNKQIRKFAQWDLLYEDTKEYLPVQTDRAD